MHLRACLIHWESTNGGTFTVSGVHETLVWWNRPFDGNMIEPQVQSTIKRTITRTITRFFKVISTNNTQRSKRFAYYIGLEELSLTGLFTN